MKGAAALIPAAGRSSRIGLATPKPFLPLGGMPMLARTIGVFDQHRGISLVQPVLPRAALDDFRRRLLERYRWRTCRPAVPGGRERQDSVYRGLAALPDDVEYVVVHDGARPFVTPQLIGAVLAAARRHGAALAAIPVTDTVKRAAHGRLVAETVERRSLWLAQTPQAFHAGLLREAHSRAREEGFCGTDDAALVEALGHPVHLVEGSVLNMKITTREDLRLARLRAEAEGRS